MEGPSWAEVVGAVGRSIVETLSRIRGALGVQVVKVAGARSWAVGGGPDPAGLEVLGQLGFEDGMSSNMVKSANNVMVVAAGLGGIKLVVMRGGV